MKPLAILAISMLLLACGDQGNNAATRDSAGIQVVENALPSRAGSIEISREPTLVIGNQTGEPYLFSRIAGAVRLADGRIVVADESSKQLRFFDSSGKFLHTAGRAGQGPGEFRDLRSLYRLQGDSLAAGDGGEALIFSATGEFVSTTNPDRPWLTLDRQSGLESIAWINSERAFVGGNWFFGERSDRPVGSRWIENFTLAISDKDSSRSVVVDTLPHYIATTRDRGRSRPYFAPYFKVATTRDAFYHGFPNEYAVRQYSNDGELKRIIRRAWTPVPVTPASIDSMVKDKERAWSKTPKETLDGWLKWLRTEPFSEVLPAYWWIHGDGAGRLWVQETSLGDQIALDRGDRFPPGENNWSVFSALGVWLTDVRMPARFKVLDIGSDYIIGSLRNSDDVEVVAMHSLLVR